MFRSRLVFGVCVCVCGTVCVRVMALRVARCGLSLTPPPPVMCEHVRGWHQATKN